MLHMGKRDNTNAVVNEKLRVRGVTNLRVADVSRMPSLNGSGRTYANAGLQAYGIGEKAADLIKGARRLKHDGYLGSRRTCLGAMNFVELNNAKGAPCARPQAFKSCYKS